MSCCYGITTTIRSRESWGGVSSGNIAGADNWSHNSCDMPFEGVSHVRGVPMVASGISPAQDISIPSLAQLTGPQIGQ